MRAASAWYVADGTLELLRGGLKTGTGLLRAAGLAWIDDPSNADVRFERVSVSLFPPVRLSVQKVELAEPGGLICRVAADQFSRQGVFCVRARREIFQLECAGTHGWTRTLRARCARNSLTSLNS